VAHTAEATVPCVFEHVSAAGERGDRILLFVYLRVDHPQDLVF